MKCYASDYCQKDKSSCSSKLDTQRDLIQRELIIERREIFNGGDR